MSQGSEHDDREPFRCPATIILLVVNGVAFAGQYAAAVYARHFPVDYYFALSREGITHGFIWQLLTFQFMHGGLVHLLVNSWVIFIFGRVIELSIGWRRMIKLYLASGVVGGLTQLLGMWWLPNLLGDVTVVGASAGAAGLAAAFAALYPNEVMVLFIPLPVPMRARSFIWFFMGFSILGILYPFLEPHVPPMVDHWVGGLFINVAHAAHLGGLVAGWLIARRLLRRRRPAPPVIQPAKTPLDVTPVGD